MKVEILPHRSEGVALPLPVYGSRAPAGFPSPADDYIEDWLDLNQHLIKHPAATFFAYAAGQSMVEAGILDRAILVVDRALTPRHRDIVIARVNGELTCKMLDSRRRQLCAANPDYAPIPIGKGSDCEIVGVVIHAINRLCTHS